MNCKNCNSPLEPQTRFCGVCGTTVAGNTPVSGADQTMPAEPIGFRPMEPTTSFPTQQPMPMAVNPPSFSQQTYSPQNQYFTPTAPLPANEQQQQRKRRGRSRLGSCLLRLVTVLVLLFAALAGLWSFVLQPYIHGMVINKLDTAMGAAVDHIPNLSQSSLPPLPFPVPPIPLPHNIPIPISEQVLTDVMRLNASSSDPIKDPTFHINEQGVRMEFNFQPNFLPFGIPCAVSFVPTVDDQGNVVVNHVNIEGIANLVVTSDDITPILNRHLKDAMTKLNNPISRIDLQPGVIVLILR